MKKLTLLILILATSLAYATPPSLTVVSATLQDSSGQVWSNATWATTFLPPFGNPGTPNNNGNPVTNNQSGVTDNVGHFTVTVDDNLVVAPAGSKWKFTVCPNASVAACNELQIVITGASMSLTTQLNAILTVPVVNAAPNLARAYSDSEANGSFGSIYINTLDNTLRSCQILSCQGTGWVALTISTNNPVFTGTLTVPCVKFNFDVANDTTVCSQGGTGHINVTLPALTGTLALLNSPTFTGVPAAPTAAPGTNTTQIASTAFVTAAVAAGTAPVTSVFGRTGAIVAVGGDYAVAQITGAAPLASPTFTGVPAAPTNGTPTDNTTQLATDAFVQSALGSGTANPGAKAVKSFTYKALVGTVAVGASSTTYLSQAVTMPSSGCPCRALVNTGVELAAPGASGVMALWIDDSTGAGSPIFGSAQYLINAAGGDGPGGYAGGMSRNTYNNGVSVTFLARAFTNGASGMTVTATPLGGTTQGTWISISVFTSN